MKVVYILSKHGENKNYVSDLGYNGFIGFTHDISGALVMKREHADAVKKLLKGTFGNAFIVDSPKGEEK